jgi:hypothetical protein
MCNLKGFRYHRGKKMRGSRTLSEKPLLMSEKTLLIAAGPMALLLLVVAALAT